jgi:hypothetical protein
MGHEQFAQAFAWFSATVTSRGLDNRLTGGNRATTRLEIAAMQ